MNNSLIHRIARGCLVVTTFLLCAPARGAEPSSPPKRIVGYMSEWGDFRAAEFPADLLTHINYAFGRITNGECTLGRSPATDPVEAVPARLVELQQLKQKHPHLKTLVSLGGWGGSGAFSEIAATPASREKFARSCAAVAVKYGFDGIDIDWEYPGGGGKDQNEARPAETKQFTALLRELRHQLDDRGAIDGKRYLLTIATSAAAQHYRNIELDQVHELLDWINVMTYDFAGSWSTVTSFNAPLFAASDNSATTAPTSAPPTTAPTTAPMTKAAARHSVDDTMRGYLAAGVPKEKLVVGVPFYGRAWGGVPPTNRGLFQPHDRKPPRPPDGGEWTYRSLAAGYITATRHSWHDEAKVPWLYDEQTGVMVSYDDPESVRLKANYVRDHQLGGLMIWEIGQDDAQHALLRALNDGLSSP